MPRATAAIRASRFTAPLLLGSGAAALLLALRAAQQSPDALEYAWNARNGRDMVHPHHVLFVPAVRLVLQALARWGRADDAILAGQLHNVAWAVAALLAMRALVRRAIGSAPLALGAALFLLFSRGFWVYATRLEIYLPALACLALLAWVAAAGGVAARGPGRTAVAAGLLALAVLYHQSNVLFVVPLTVLCVAGRGRAGWREAAVIVGLAGTVTLAGYILAYRGAGPPTVAGFVHWVLSYAYEPVPAWGSFAHYGPAGLGALLRSQAADLTGVPARLAPVMVPVLGVAVAALVVWHLRALRCPDGARPLRLFGLTWLLVHYLFFLWWLPTDTDFFVVSLVPLVLLGALAGHDLAAGRPWVARVGAVAIGVLAAGNLVATVLPLHASRGTDYALAARLHAIAPAGCAVGTRFGVRENLGYHFGREAIDLDLPLLWALDGRDPAGTATPAIDCLLVPAGQLRPGREVGGQDGVREPARWLTWLCWLVDSRRASDGAVVSCRQITSVDGGAEGVCALIGPGRLDVAGVDGLVALLDAQVGGGAPGPWSTWLRDARAAGRLP